MLGARVVRVTHPGREDPFVLHDELLRGSDEVPLDLGDAAQLERFMALLADADLLVDGTTPRVLANVGLDDPPLPVVRVAAFAHEDRPGYGIAAECRGGWAARYDPPRVGRAAVADPVAGLLAAVVAVDVLTRAVIVHGNVCRSKERSGISSAWRRSVADRLRVSARGAVTEIVFDHPPINIYDIATARRAVRRARRCRRRSGCARARVHGRR